MKIEIVSYHCELPVSVHFGVRTLAKKITSKAAASRKVKTAAPIDGVRRRSRTALVQAAARANVPLTTLAHKSTPPRATAPLNAKEDTVPRRPASAPQTTFTQATSRTQPAPAPTPRLKTVRQAAEAAATPLTSTPVHSTTKANATPKAKPAPSKRRTWANFITYPIAFVFISLLVFSGLKIFQWFQDDISNRTQQQYALEDANLQAVEDEGELVNPPAEEAAQEDDYWYYAKMPFYSVDFDALQAKNSDTVAFIHMNDSNVNYPVVQTSDNDYYLGHAFDRTVNDAGWVYMDYRSTLPAENTVIYGHGRWNGTVFGTLKNALNADWQANKDNYVIWLSTPTENFVYQIFAIYVVPAENLYLMRNFDSAEQKSEWLSIMKSRNVAPIDVSVSPSDQILTLSTCLDDRDNRVVIQAKLIKRLAR